MTRQYAFAPGEYYHIYNRGIEKRQIFLDDKDRTRFIQLLFFCNGTQPVSIRDLPKTASFENSIEKRGDPLAAIGAYCLMPNHFHILVKALSDDGVSIFMQKLMTAYSMYFNTKNERKGRLFESSYQSTHAADDTYLKYLYAYIHLNPVKLVQHNWREEGIRNVKEVEKYLSDYDFSSFSDYSGIDRDSGLILQKEEFPDYFPLPVNFTDSIFDWIHFPEV